MSRLILWIGTFSLLAFVHSSVAQEQKTSQNSLIGAFHTTESHIPRERIFLHTDKSLYVTGETLWFSLYCLEEALLTSSPYSSVAYVELLDASSQPVLQEKIRLSSGRGYGQLFFSPDIQSGLYHLRAYTSWMRNQGPGTFFETPIYLVHPLLGPASPTPGPAATATDPLDETPSNASQLIRESGRFFLQPNKEALSSSEIFLLVHNKGILQFFQKLPKDSKRIELPVADFPPGTYEARLLSASQKLLSVHSFFVPPRNPATLNLSVENSQVSPRQKINITLEYQTLGTEPQGTNLSVSVYKILPELELPKPTAPASLWLPPPLRLDRLPEGENALQNLHQRLQKTEFQKYFRRHERIDSFPFLPEWQAPILHGKLSQDLEEGPLLVSFPGKKAQLYPVTVDSTGNFHVEVSPYIASTDMIFWTPQKAIKRSSIQLDTPFSSAPLSSPYTFELTPEWQPLIAAYTFNAQVGNLYLDSTYFRGKPFAQFVTDQPFYGKAKYSYLLDEYTRFPNLEEVFLEYVRYALKRNQKGQRYIYVWDEYKNDASMGNSIPFPQPALTLIDGVPILDPEFIWGFDVLKVKQLDLVTKEYFVDNFSFNGIAHFITYTHNFGGEKLPEDISSIPYKPLQPARTFYSPQYPQGSSATSHIPDYRNTLYWNPEVSLQGAPLTLEFFASDEVGTYKIEVNGISDTGTPLYAESLLFVTVPSK